MTERLSGKVALITGGSRGIGRAIAEQYVKEGASLVLNARGREALETAAAELRTFGQSVLVFPADVTDAPAVQAMVAAAVAEFGQIDILVNNAGVYQPAPFMGYSFDVFAQVVQTNIYGVFHVTQAVLKEMIARKSGRIVNIASTAGKWGSRNQSAYNTSKHAIIGLTRSLALEMAPFNITVNAVCPWFVDTDMASGALEEHAKIMGVGAEQVLQALLSSGPKKRLVRPEEVAHMAVYLASDEADMVNGQSFVIDGGYTMI